MWASTVTLWQSAKRWAIAIRLISLFALCAGTAIALLQALVELSEAALRRSLTHLQAVEFLYETRFFPASAYTFKHALTHEVAYGSLLLERRRALHARIVQDHWLNRLPRHLQQQA